MTAVTAHDFSAGYDPRSLRHTLGLSRERMARLFDVSSKTIERWEVSGAVPSGRYARSQLAKLNEIVKLGLIVYTPEGFSSFMTHPLPALGGRTPLQAIEQGDADLVYGELGGDYEGAGY